VGYTALALFALAYVFVMVEEFTHFRKSKPVILVAGVIIEFQAEITVYCDTCTRETIY
jgi:hypothetical protein